MLHYYITDRTQFSGPEQSRREQLIKRVAEAAREGVDYVQIREKDLSSHDLETLAGEVIEQVRRIGAKIRVLINSRTDLALAVGADGVHLRSNDVSPADVRRIWSAANTSSRPVIAVSCHSDKEVLAAKIAGADFVVFGPVFGKSTTPGVGLTALHAACRHGITVFALGGVTVENAASCIQAGAQGAAGIRLFQEGDVRATIGKLRAQNE